MPAMPVALTGKVKRIVRLKACRSISCVSFMICRKCGSRWPTSGVAMAVQHARMSVAGAGTQEQSW